MIWVLENKLGLHDLIFLAIWQVSSLVNIFLVSYLHKNIDLSICNTHMCVYTHTHTHIYIQACVVVFKQKPLLGYPIPSALLLNLVWFIMKEKRKSCLSCLSFLHLDITVVSMLRLMNPTFPPTLSDVKATEWFPTYSLASVLSLVVFSPQFTQSPLLETKHVCKSSCMTFLLHLDTFL